MGTVGMVDSDRVGRDRVGMVGMVGMVGLVDRDRVDMDRVGMVDRDRVGRGRGVDELVQGEVEGVEVFSQ